MGNDMPYMYNYAQQSGSTFEFNPRAYTQSINYAASMQSEARRSRQQQKGPLVEINRHPDSWMIVASTTNNTTVSPRVKEGILVTRWVQFSLRLLQLLVAVGIFVCTVCIRGTQDAATYLLRIPVSMITTVTKLVLTSSSLLMMHFFAPMPSTTSLLIRNSGLRLLQLATTFSRSAWTPVWPHSMSTSACLLRTTGLRPSVPMDAGGHTSIRIGRPTLSSTPFSSPQLLSPVCTSSVLFWTSSSSCGSARSPMCPQT